MDEIADATKKSARLINKALDKGHIVLLGFNKPGEGQEQYLYDIETSCRDAGAKSLADEYVFVSSVELSDQQGRVTIWMVRAKLIKQVRSS